MKTRRYQAMLILLVILSWGTAAVAQQEAVIFDLNKIGGARAPEIDMVIGWRFRLTQDIFVSDLGIYTHGDSDLRGIWNVGIWKLNQWTGHSDGTENWGTVVDTASATITSTLSQKTVYDQGTWCYKNINEGNVLLPATETVDVDGEPTVVPIWYLVAAWRTDGLEDKVLLEIAEDGEAIANEGPGIIKPLVPLTGSAPVAAPPAWLAALTPIHYIDPDNKLIRTYTEYYGVNFKYTTEPPPTVVAVDIDIKPGSYPNCINLGSNGVVPVAILSTAGFDATTVNPETVTLAGAGVAVRGKGNKYLASKEDVDGDGLTDLMLKVETENLDPGQFQDGYAFLVGMTCDGKEVEGLDEITIVPPQ